MSGSRVPRRLRLGPLIRRIRFTIVLASKRFRSCGALREHLVRIPERDQMAREENNRVGKEKKYANVSERRWKLFLHQK